MSSADALELAPDAQQALFALMELGHLDDAGLDELADRLQALPSPVDSTAFRRVAAALLFEQPPADPEQLKLLGAEWSLLFG